MYPFRVAALVVAAVALGGGCQGGGVDGASPTPERDARTPGVSEVGGGGSSARLADVGLTVVGDELRLRDHATGNDIVSPSGWPMWRHVKDRARTLRPEVVAREAEGGVDITYTFRNQGDRAMQIGQFSIGGIMLAGEVERLRIGLDGRMGPVDMNNARQPADTIYPGHAYAPVMVLRDDRYTVGVSLNYDVLEHRHFTTVSSFMPGGREDNGWRITFAPNVFASHRDEGDIQPGQERTYTLSVRIMKGAKGDDWVHTLAPYRDFFRSVHGEVDYQRDPRPVYAFPLAQGAQASATNPRGYTYPTTRDPERFGWGPWVDHLDQVASRGFERFLMIAPTGVFKDHPKTNFPFQFTSPWKTRPGLWGSMGELRAFAQREQLGLWWGRATSVMGAWDDGRHEDFDPKNADHIRRVVEELDGAVEAGARTIGLDAFSGVDPWAGWAFLDIVQATHPDVKFIVEPMTSDLFHNRAGSYLWVTRPPSQAGRAAQGRHLLADYLNPGHETWGRIDPRAIQSLEGLTKGERIPENAVESWVRRAAEWGYVPVVHFAMDVGARHRAASTGGGR